MTATIKKNQESLASACLSIFRSLSPEVKRELVITLNEDWKREDELRRRFDSLYEQWWHETCVSSDYGLFTRHPAFKEIVAMGTDATPLIVEKLKEQPSFLVKALNRIYGERISPDSRLPLKEVCQLWIEKLGY